MERLKRIAAIHDLSGMGKCSLTVALPVISASGVECACIPTALLSTHTGEFTGYTVRDLSEDMLPIAEHWITTGARFDGIYSGYLASAEQAETVKQIIELLSDGNTTVVVDPVMADNGEYYSHHGEEMCRAFRALCRRADVITPNVTEAALLTGMSYEPGPHSEEYIDGLLEGLADFCGGVAAVTGVRPDENSVGVVTADLHTGEKFLTARPLAEGVFYGTGDLFASALAALLVRGAGLEESAQLAVRLVTASIERTVAQGSPRRFGVDFEGALPEYVRAVSELFE